MSPVTHLLVGWTVALAPGLDRRGRAAVALAGVAPDLDGAGLLVDLATRHTQSPTELWGAWHHVLGHGLVAAVTTAAVVGVVVRQRRVLAILLALLSFHLHVLGDLVGARGPDGEQWPLFYLWPLRRDLGLTWDGQWALNAWPNLALTLGLLALTFGVAWRRGLSPLELVSARADHAFVAALRQRFGPPAP